MAILAILLGLSLWGNGCQYKRSITAPLRAESAALKDAADKSLQLANDGQERERKLLEAAEVAAGQLSGAGKDYRRAVANRPLDAHCAPGLERMDATNKALGQRQ